MASFIELMIVEDEPEVRESFRLALSQQREMKLVYETDSEHRAFEYLEIHAVDVIILDIELKEGDGLSLLNDIETYGLEKPFIIVVTNTGSYATLNYLRVHGADFICQKTNGTYSPENVLGMIKKLYPYQKLENQKRSMDVMTLFQRNKEDQILRKYIADELGKVGFERSQTGFCYIAEGIFLMMNDKEDCLQMSSDIYPAIAEKYHVTQESVMHGIRNAIEKVFKKAAIKNLEIYYPFDYDKEKGRPTNTEFLKNMTERLRI